MDWWMWAALGLVLAVGEVLTPGGFFIVFFGLAALVVALLAFLGLAGPLWFQILLFSIFSVVSLLLFRNPLLRWMARHTKPTVEVDSLVGEIAVASAAMPAGGSTDTAGEIEDWGRAAGFDPERRERLSPMSELITLRRPA